MSHKSRWRATRNAYPKIAIKYFVSICCHRFVNAHSGSTKRNMALRSQRKQRRSTTGLCFWENYSITTSLSLQRFAILTASIAHIPSILLLLLLLLLRLSQNHQTFHHRLKINKVKFENISLRLKSSNATTPSAHHHLEHPSDHQPEHQPQWCLQVNVF